MNKPIICSACNGEMKPYTGKKYPAKVSGFMIVGGAFCTLFWIGAVIGLPMIIAGLYMTGAKRQLLICGDCNMAIERIVIKKKQ